VLRNFSRFRLRAHHLKVESCKWHGGSSICDKSECGEVQDEKHVLFFCKCAEVCKLCMRYKDLFEGMSKKACVCSFELWIYSFLNLSSQYHWFWDQCIPESRLIQTPQVCVRFSFNFRHWLILFVSPANCHQPESRAVGHPCNPCNPWGVVFTACIVFSPSQHWNRTKNTRLTLPNQSTMIRHNAA